MMLVLLVVIAILALLVYGLVWHSGDSAKFKLVHAAAMKAYSTDEPVDLRGVSTGAVSQFFSIYGTTKYKAITFPLVLYAGYARLGEQDTVVIAIYHGGVMTITTQEPPYTFDDEGKAEFLESVVAFFKTEVEQQN